MEFENDNRRMLGRMMFNVPNLDESSADSELLPSSIAAIAPMLRAAKYIETDNPRVAYLCRFHAFEEAHKMDPTASGRGVRQFKTYLLNRLHKEEETTKPMLAKTDPKELQMYYQKFCEDNIKIGEDKKTPEELAKLYQIATVLYDVIKAAVPPKKIDKQTHRYAEEVVRKNNVLLQNQQLAHNEHKEELEKEVAGLRRRTEELETKFGVVEEMINNKEKVTDELRGKIKGLESNIAEGKSELQKLKTEKRVVDDPSATSANCDLPVSTDNQLRLQPLLTTGDRLVETATPWWKNCCGVLDLLDEEDKVP